MKAFYCDTYDLPLPRNHRFPMAKYRKLRQRLVDSDEPGDGPGDGSGDGLEFVLPPALSNEQIALAHDRDYIEKASTGRLSQEMIRALGFPWSMQLVERSRRSAGATAMALKSSVTDGVSVNLAGGTHHAHHDRPQGFCLFNDSVIAARMWQQSGLGRSPLIIDCDVHQGNGTASILENDCSIFTFSMHCEKNFPVTKALSDLDIPLEIGCDDETYLNALALGLERIPQLFEADCVIYVAGADPYEGDRLGKLSLTKSGLADRDRLVFEFCRKYHLPCAVSMAGGYAHDVDQIVDIHFNTVKTAQAFSSHSFGV